MEIGTRTNSLVNHLQARAVIGEPKPVVGMGVTLLGWTDRNPGTIVSVQEVAGSKVTAYLIEVTSDDYKVISGNQFDGTAKYEFTPCPEGYRTLYRKNKKTGFWDSVHVSKETGRLVNNKGNGLRIGERDKHYDPSF